MNAPSWNGKNAHKVSGVKIECEWKTKDLAKLVLVTVSVIHFYNESFLKNIPDWTIVIHSIAVRICSFS